MAGLKICRGCKQAKSVSKYYFVDGRARSLCKKCFLKDGRKNHLKRKYGLTLEEYSALLTQQHGVCAICRRFSQQFVIDHNHDTGKVRGVLCIPCNSGIGLMKDSPLQLRAAAQYLEKYGRS